jgi:hypothetical protein
MTSSYKDCPQSDGLQLETARSPLAHLLKKEPGFMRLWNGIDETGRVEIRETGCCQSHRIKAPTSPEPAKNRQSVRMFQLWRRNSSKYHGEVRFKAARRRSGGVSNCSHVAMLRRGTLFAAQSRCRKAPDFGAHEWW